MREDGASAANSLLGWYDGNARALPWRVPPADIGRGIRPDPYRVWLSEIMLQQTAVAAAIPYFRVFTRRWPTVGELAAAADDEVMAAWAGLGYYARARNLLKCARVVARDLNGDFPETEDGLRRLPGIGPYTAAAIAAIAFDRRAVVVDGNVKRVVARLFAVETPLPAAKGELRRLAATLVPRSRPGDFAQAMMDLGATVCTRAKPVCRACPMARACRGRREGTAAGLPRRAPKAPKPVRRGILYFVEREDGALLLETRPPEGLLGGMLGFPSTAWQVDTPPEAPPLRADWRPLPGEVRHSFTHFHLVLTIHHARVGAGAVAERGRFMPPGTDLPLALPSVMRKALRLAAAA
ncbi:MAG: A/G-specific adenine glycosylase [Paracoccaceae bacterium]